MPFVPNTPESLLGRSDSKNPSTTCRGITSSGRPCRRPVGAASSPANTPTKNKAAVSSHLDPDATDERLYCWQHKEQASSSARSSPGPRKTATPILEGRTSLDTLADRLGLVNGETIPAAAGKKKKSRIGRHDWEGSSSSSSKPPRKERPTKEGKTLQFCFCFTVPIEEVEEKPRPARPQPRPVQQMTSASVPVPGRPSQPPNPGLSPSRRPRPSSNSLPANSPGKNSHRSSKSTASQTAQYMSLIPETTDPQTASALMAELARPYVGSEEAGYIYMFWMTPTSSTTPPPVDAARSLLLAPPSPSRKQRRASDVVSSFADSHSRSKSNKTMLLKIGRAANVQRRMNQWSRQCDYDVEVLRYYPYLPSGASSEASVTAVPRMTPHCHRVERLVHIELAGMGLKADLDTCQACGKDHREWFEVRAARSAVGAVDEVIRRWVEWDERQSL